MHCDHRHQIGSCIDEVLQCKAEVRRITSAHTSLLAFSRRRQFLAAHEPAKLFAVGDREEINN